MAYEYIFDKNKCGIHPCVENMEVQNAMQVVEGIWKWIS